MSYVLDEQDPKSPRPLELRKKREGADERGESRKDRDRDVRPDVHVRC